MPEVSAFTIQLPLEIPEGFKLVEKEEWNKLIASYDDEPLDGNKKWAMKKVGIGTDKDFESTIIQPFYDELKVENGGPIKFGSGSGQTWHVNKKHFEQWYNKNFHRVYGK